MKSMKSYIPSLILSVFFVFALLGTSVIMVVNNFADAEKLKELSVKNGISAQIRSQLSEHYSDTYNATGIPATVYMNSLTDEYIQSVVDMYIDNAFEYMGSSNAPNFTVPSNPKLESDICSCFESYADSIGYQKDDYIYIKVDETISAAYGTIGQYCDVYKLSSLFNHNILGKFRGLYSNIDRIAFAAIAVTAFIAFLIVMVNVKQKKHSVYWCGISAIVSGVIGAVPSIYLICTKYFDSFTIKQPQIFTSFTKLMYNGVSNLLFNEIVILAVGMILTVIYMVTRKKHE